MRFAFLWNRYGLRGRGYVPRQIGRRFLKNRTYIMQTKHGAKLIIDPINLDIYAAIFNSSGEWEPHVAQTCRRLLRKDDVFFDVGANCGCISLDTRASMKEHITMCLFEPQPSLASSLRRSIAVNCFDNIRVFDFLLGNYDGTAELYLTSHAIHASMIPREKTFDKILLPIWRMDSLIANGTCPPPDIIKIDTEGAELQIMQGMSITLGKFSPSLLFEADSNMTRFGYATSDLIKLLRSMSDYEFYEILPKGSLRKYEGQAASNILAVAPRHRKRLDQNWLD
jgi:FkbM family methyltransferase